MSTAYRYLVLLPVGPIVFQQVPAAVALTSYVVSTAVIAWVTVDARRRGLRWPIWLFLAICLGPIAWILYGIYFRAGSREEDAR